MLKRIYTVYKSNQLDREIARHRVSMVFISYNVAA